MSLRDCFDCYNGRPVGKIDHFFDVYEPHFYKFRNTAVKLLEIGVHNGGSLELWREYFGEAAVIHGIDIDPTAANRAPADSVIHIGSQDDTLFLQAIIDEHGPFDIIIDDGSHLMPHQIASFETLYPELSEQGVYVCEDAFTSYWQEFGGKLGAPDTFIEYARGLVDELHAFWAVDAKLEPTPFTRTTRGIHFYSGAVVFQRHPVDEPVYIVKGNDLSQAISIADLKLASARK